MRSRFIFISLLCASLFFPLNLFGAPQTVQAQSVQDGESVPGELIVIMQAGEKVSALSLPEKARAVTKKRSGLEKLNAGVISVPVGEESAYIARIKKQRGVMVVEPNYRISADLYPNDPAYSTDQYGPALIQAESAWDTTSGSSSVVIAIIDSGLDASHPEFAGRTVAGYDFVEDDTVSQDECGHGTHVAGIAAATGNNNQGVAGVAWNVKIMPLRVLNSFCGGSYADVAEALIWAADHGAQIINLSLGGPSPSILMENAIYYAYSHGSAIFAASGNANASTVYYPAAYPQVMAVGSVNSRSIRTSSSNYGAALDLMAPGDSIYSTMPMESGFLYNTLYGSSTQYDYLGGTSMASPHAAGAAALLASMPSCFETPSQIYQALIDSARDLGGLGWDNEYGYGLIQIADALLECPASPSPIPFNIEYDLVTSNNCEPLAQYGWRDATSGTWEAPVGSSSSVLVSLPFTFNFGGQPYSSIRVHANGFISLGDNNTGTTDNNYGSNFPLPTAARPDNFIAPFWDNLTDNSGTGRIYTEVQGTTPNREFIIEYWNFKQVEAPGGNLHFEIILFEGTDEILIQYRALSGTGSDGSSATVGIEYGNTFSGFAAYQYSYNRRGALENGLALRFIPYASGSPTLPSNAVCPQTRAVTIEPGFEAICNTVPAAFSVNIAAGELPYRSALKIQQLGTGPAMPSPLLDLQHYADINLAYSPPAPSLSPMPEVYVCYEYTPQDILAAGGHPENLFIAAHDITTNQWQRLPTTVDESSSHLMALAPHFSYYGVATLNPSNTAPGDSNHTANGLGFPVTGAPFSRELSTSLSIAFSAGLVLLLGIAWSTRNRK